jgi:hypothetical protein
MGVTIATPAPLKIAIFSSFAITAGMVLHASMPFLFYDILRDASLFELPHRSKNSHSGLSPFMLIFVSPAYAQPSLHASMQEGCAHAGTIS